MLLEGGLILVQNARLSYPNLTKPSRPKAYPDSPLMYSADLVIPANDQVVSEAMQLINSLGEEKWKANYPNVMAAINQDKKARSFGKGEERVDKNFQRLLERYPDGTFFISAKAKQDEKPTMIRPDGTPVLANDDQGYFDIARSIYDGCRVNAVIRPWLRISNPGVSFRLHAVQFAGEDEKFATSGNPDMSGIFGAAAGPAPTMGGFTPEAPAAGMPDFMK